MIGWQSVTTVFESVHRFVRDEDAQDLVEYALLGMFVGVVGVIVWSNIVTLLGARYTEYNTNVQDLWVPPDP
jgi:Flp pilus assembly pilin Flp